MTAATAGIVVALLGAIPAAAVGVADVDLAVALPEDGDGRPQLALDDATDVEVRLANLADEPRHVRVYAVAATPTPDGSFALGDPASAGWFGLGDQRVDLRERERRSLIATLRRSALPDGTTHVAVVIETGTDTTLVTRAARVIELGEHPAASVPLALLLLAVLLVLLAVSAHVWRLRHDRSTAHA